MDEMGAWLAVILAGALEPVWVVMLDRSENFKKPLWGAASLILVVFCLYLLALGVATIGPGVAYAVLAGIAAVGVMAAGRVLYRERITAKRMCFVAMIAIGIIGVRLVSGGIV